MISRATYQKQWRAERRCNAQRYILARIKAAARSRGLTFALTAADIPAFPEYCPVFNVKLVYEVGYKGDDHAEVDRINNELGYVRGNIRFISRRANRIKSDATAQEIYWLWLDAKAHGAVEPAF